MQVLAAAEALRLLARFHPSWRHQSLVCQHHERGRIPLSAHRHPLEVDEGPTLIHRCR